MADDTVVIRGQAFSAASCILKVATLTITGWTAIDWESARERKPVMAQDGTLMPTSVTKGKVNFSPLKLTLRRETAALIRAKLAALAGGNSFGDAFGYGATLQYIEGTKVEQVEWREMWWAKGSGGEKEGTDESQTTVELGYLKLLENGLTIGSVAR